MYLILLTLNDSNRTVPIFIILRIVILYGFVYEVVYNSHYTADVQENDLIPRDAYSVSGNVVAAS